MLEWNQIPFGWREALDIAVVAFLFYHVIRFVRGTRAMAAINGLFVLLVLYVVAQMVGLLTLVWLLENVFGSLFLVIVVLFHQDIRQALSSMSLRSLFRRRTGGHEELIRTLARTCCDLAAKRIGAIIVVEMTVPLGDMMEKGVKIDGQVSEDLLSTIFFPNTALHDGAVIVNLSGRVVAAGCVLPLAQVAPFFTSDRSTVYARSRECRPRRSSPGPRSRTEMRLTIPSRTTNPSGRPR